MKCHETNVDNNKDECHHAEQRHACKHGPRSAQSSINSNINAYNIGEQSSRGYNGLRDRGWNHGDEERGSLRE